MEQQNTTEPLMLADGTLIDTTDGSVLLEEGQEFVEVPNYAEAQRDIVAARMRIHELPAPPERLNTISVVLVYSLMGVTDEDIATILHADEETIGAIRMSDVYTEVKKNFIDSIVQNDLDDVRNMFVESSRTAANVMTTALGSKSEAVRMSAARDVLDRAGHRPADVVEHRHSVEGGLRIEYVDKTKEEGIPTIDITPERVL